MSHQQQHQIPNINLLPQHLQHQFAQQHQNAYPNQSLQFQHHFQQQLHQLQQQQQLSVVTPPTLLSPSQTNESNIEQNTCTPTSESNSDCSDLHLNKNSNPSPLDYNLFVSSAAASTPIMSPLIANITNTNTTAPPKSFEIRNFLNNPETICETAARLLFMCVRWAKSIPAFVNLDMSDQLLLLEEGWREIFLLSAAQFQMPLDDIDSLLANAGITPETTDPEKLVKIMIEMQTLQEIIAKFKQSQVDPTEYACLKAITLFKTAVTVKNEPSSDTTTDEISNSMNTSCDHNETFDNKNLKDLENIISFQEQTQMTLSKYDAHAYSTHPYRYGKLLLLLPVLRTVSSQTIEELFFKKTIGNISIERVILDMYKSPMAN